MALPNPSIETLSTVGEGGQRNFLHPADVHGRFTRLRRVLSWLLIGVLVALPLIEIGGKPGVWIDLRHRSFHVLGATFGPTHGWLLFFLLTGIGFALVVASALWGRVWCGYACPQTVFLEGVYRRIERLFEGSRPRQMQLDAAPWGLEKLWRRGGKNLAFVLVSAALAHALVAYFVPVWRLAELVRAGPAADPEVFAWTAALTAAFFFNFAWFREQLCIIVCPYGRLQSALSDRDTVVVGYDARRGEPRGKATETGKGDCVDCTRCVAVCPTGIDIRQGMQLECVGCAACIDACDEVMVKVGRERGLIRYDSHRGLSGEGRRFWRPRVAVYGVLGALGLGALAATALTRPSLPATLMRQAGPPFVVEGGQVRNAWLVRLSNKTGAAQTLSISVQAGSAEVTLPQPTVSVSPNGQVAVPFFVSVPRDSFAEPFDVRVVVSDEAGRKAELSARFLGPKVR